MCYTVMSAENLFGNEGLAGQWFTGVCGIGLKNVCGFDEKKK